MKIENIIKNDLPDVFKLHYNNEYIRKMILRYKSDLSVIMIRKMIKTFGTDKTFWKLLELYQSKNLPCDLLVKKKPIEEDVDTIIKTQQVSIDFIIENQNYGSPHYWRLVSKHQKLTQGVIKKYRDKLDWKELCRYQKGIFDDKFTEKMTKHIEWYELSYNTDLLSDAFVETNMIKFQKLNSEILFNYRKLTNNFILRNYYPSHNYESGPNDLNLSANGNWTMTEEILDRWNNYFDRSALSRYQKFTTSLIIKYHKKLNWKNISRFQRLEPECIDRFCEKLDWEIMSKYQRFTELIMRKHYKRLNWISVGQYQNLSMSFIYEFYSYLDQSIISKYQKLSEDFIIERFNVLDRIYILKYQKISYDVFIKLYLGRDLAVMNKHYEAAHFLSDHCDTRYYLYAKYQNIDKETVNENYQKIPARALKMNKKIKLDWKFCHQLKVIVDMRLQDELHNIHKLYDIRISFQPKIKFYLVIVQD